MNSEISNGNRRFQNALAIVAAAIITKNGNYYKIASGRFQEF
jgi:hypothetical protein